MKVFEIARIIWDYLTDLALSISNVEFFRDFSQKADQTEQQKMA
jgi:hypothetical protein